MAAEKTTMKVNIVAADHPVWHGDAASVTIPASEGGMGILPDHEPVSYTHLDVYKRQVQAERHPHPGSGLCRHGR